MQEQIPFNPKENREKYELADAVLRNYAAVLSEYPPIKNLPTNTTLEVYLKGIANIIAGLLPFAYRGIGLSTIEQQATHLSAVRTPADIE